MYDSKVEEIMRLEEEAKQTSALLKTSAQEAAAATERAAFAEAEIARLQAEVEGHERQIALLEVSFPILASILNGVAMWKPGSY